MANLPDRLYIDKADRVLYDNDIINNEILYGKTRKDQFLFTMAIGFKNKVKRSLESREGFFLAKDLHTKDEALIDIVAVYDNGSVDLLHKREDVYRIAEEYAHAGIRLLYDEVSSGQPGSYFKKLELELTKLVESINK